MKCISYTLARYVLATDISVLANVNRQVQWGQYRPLSNAITSVLRHGGYLWLIASWYTMVTIQEHGSSIREKRICLRDWQESYVLQRRIWVKVCGVFTGAQTITRACRCCTLVKLIVATVQQLPHCIATMLHFNHVNNTLQYADAHKDLLLEEQ